MKKAIIVSIVIFISLSVKSQGYETWSDPVALTDSSSYNSNPEVAVLNSDNAYMFYEKRQNQTGNSEIWWKKISYPMSNEQMLIGGYPEADYRNPKVVSGNFLIFECNATNNGNYDILGVKFDENGLVGNTFRLTNTEQDENSFFGTRSLSICCWENDGGIYVANIDYVADTLRFTDIETIDTLNCFDPVCTFTSIAWRKTENNESHIYYSIRPWGEPEWTEPDTIMQTNDNTRLSISRTLDFMGGGNYFCWQSPGNIYYCEIPLNWVNITSPDIEGIDNYYEPTAFDPIITVDYVNSINALYSFVGETNSIRNIYIVDEMLTGEVVNITNDTLVNKNPTMFAGKIFNFSYDVYNVWQTEIVGHDVLFSSMATYLFGGIDENKNIKINIFPNPVSKNQNITINSTENIKIHSAQVYSVSGKLVSETDFEPNTVKYEIDLGNSLPGVYFIKIQTSKGKTVRKFIRK